MSRLHSDNQSHIILLPCSTTKLAWMLLRTSFLITPIAKFTSVLPHHNIHHAALYNSFCEDEHLKRCYWDHPHRTYKHTVIAFVGRDGQCAEYWLACLLRFCDNHLPDFQIGEQEKLIWITLWVSCWHCMQIVNGFYFQVCLVNMDKVYMYFKPFLTDKSRVHVLLKVQLPKAQL